jgi:hypothetical protein
MLSEAITGRGDAAFEYYKARDLIVNGSPVRGTLVPPR